MEPKRPDIDGNEELTRVILELVNECPLLDGERISFGAIEDIGFTLYPTSGAVVTSELVSVTGHVRQTCAYPFIILNRVFGTSENRKITTKDTLDKIGRWLERQPITHNGVEYVLDYPVGARQITKIERTSPAYLESVEQNKAENWVIACQVTYIYEYDL